MSYIIQTGAKFSPDRKYRYKLWRARDHYLPRIMYIGINPSTADGANDDATIRRVTAFSWKMGYGKFYMLNLFPYVATKQKDLKTDANMEAIVNLQYLEDIGRKVDTIVFAWGRNKLAKPLVKSMNKMFPNAMCFGHNLDGSPKHPLFLSGDTRFIPFKRLSK